MEKLSNIFKKARYSYRALPDKKQYIEFFTALLTVPVLLTVIIVNLGNIQKGETDEKQNDQRPIVVTAAPREENTEGDSDITPEVCIEEIGPISIASPHENERVEDNPLLIDINYNSRGYCAVVWAYRINNGRLSDYGSNDIAIYNPPQGTVRFELRVRSLVTGEEEVLRRTFTYEGVSSVPTPTDTPQASGSAN